MSLYVEVKVKGENKRFYVAFMRNGIVTSTALGNMGIMQKENDGSWRFLIRAVPSVRFTGRTREEAVRRWEDWRNRRIWHCASCSRLFPVDQLVTIKGVQVCREHADPDSIISIF
jgi:hypothetical protein